MITREVRLQSTPITLASPLYSAWVRLNQYALILPWMLVTQTLIKRRVTVELSRADLKANVHYVIAANHQSQIDTFIICRELPVSLWKRLGVFRVLVYDKVFQNPWLWALMVAIGGFPARPARNMPFGLEATRAFMARHQTIMIFPEARRSLPREVAPRSGVAVLAAYPQVRVIPVHIQWTKRGWRRSYQLTIGKPLAAQLSAQRIMDEIYNLSLPR